ncbi:S9 family peptidase [Arthrospiribacter ruber]|uniref:Proline-specific endopeptidase n=1 Tax=Arthrospiribacter ruber TaxID=2487934 RepID=A0A951MF46_9BACT|nr:S9 family peptidase [Arthrospiribacter ruber]MBW3469632.1 S9 family peptidase [Arthrospiribacter ruber]
MKNKIKNLLIFSLAMSTACSQQEPDFQYPEVYPPMAEVKPHEIIAKHGHVRVDNYYWLNDREDQKVIDYLNAENAYMDSMLAHTKDFQNSLFKEMRSRIKEDDASVPYKLDDFYYYTKYVEGGEYPIYARKKGSMDAKEEILVDGNELGKEEAYLNFFTSVSHDHNLIAIIKDTQGRNFYNVSIKDLRTGEMLEDKIENIRSSAVWSTDNKSFYYSIPDPVTLRNYQVKRHVLGQDASQDEVIFEEKDPTLNCGVGLTKSKKYIIIGSGRTDASYAFYLDADKPGSPKLIAPIEDNVQYSVDHAGGEDFYIHTNQDAVNYRLVKAPVSNPSKANWSDVIPNRPDIFLESVDYFKDYMAVEETKEGLARIRIVKFEDGSEYEIEFDEPAYSAGLGYNPAFDTEVVRYSYTSMTTPNSVFDFNMKTKEKELMKEQPVLGDFDKNNYQTERVMVTARDGKKVPMSIVYRKDKFKKDGSMPGWIYAYGSYGYSMDASFSSSRLSLLDRGMVYAIAHIRGGQEMGGDWYEDGKMMNKKNSFYDFIDCSKWLQDNGYVAKDKLFASGGSAGGLLMGGILNMAPEVYRGVIAAVAFVDVVTTMMDESIPLTTFEWLEWGNPNIQEQYEYMLSYSPYDNVEAKDYPHILATTGLHDSQVQYWEPAKWVAKLRTMKTDNNRLFLYTNMDAGHGGASGRFERLKEVAREYAFVFDILGIRE